MGADEHVSASRSYREQIITDTFDIIQDVKKRVIEQKRIMLFRMVTELRYKNLIAKNKAWFLRQH